ncbi:hypothetical protein Pmani_023335 [Petrolisthes manimaculis]|uniref:Endothelin-converting enzyme 1 n=1 Tax=Petrolisthes manimaculis TaxID=1843537 RepID=A0AAE1PC54_9EUCA|nr:hypothetical protein Pmani_023335 [Petrolisthes manimaculis]
MCEVGVLLGGEEDVARAAAMDIVDLEHQLATITTPDEDRRQNDNLYQLKTIKELNNLAPFMDWHRFLNAAFIKVNKMLSPDDKVVVYATDYLKNLTYILKNMTSNEKGKQTVHNYLVWHGIRGYLGFLSRDFREAGRDLEKAEVGVAGAEAAWRECVAVTDASLGPALGAMFVRQAFNKEAKTMAEQMIKHVRTTFMQNLMSVKWMDNKTMDAAVLKAESITEMIGYPEYILNPDELDDKFADLNVTEDNFFANNIAVNDFNVKENLKRLFKPVNKTRWDMTPPTVNAYYSPTRNDIAFPAGILQAPFFDHSNLQSLNYGAIGVVMGHELAHAFDDQGRRYDSKGNMHQWWEEETVRKFKNLTTCMEDQYSEYDFDGEHLNGKLTLGENIADNGGLEASFRAYNEWIEHHGSEVSLPGLTLTNQQLFFLGFAQVWCSAITKEAAHLEILKDPHVPGQFRVLGTLSNSWDFAQAFSCQKGTRMNPEKKCHIW